MATQKFNWAPAADVGLGLLGGLNQYGQAYASNVVSKANAAAQNTIRKANNKVANANAGLAATLRGINQDRMMSAAGSAYNAAGRTLQRQQESFARLNFNSYLQAESELGAQAASLAQSGVGGTSMAMLSQASALKAQRQVQLRKEQQGQMQREGADQMSSIIPNALASRDVGTIGIQQDYGVSSPSLIQSNLFTSLATGLLSKSDSMNLLLNQAPTNQASGEETGLTLKSSPTIRVLSQPYP